MKSPNTLVATLGGQPQIVTFTLDLLLARGEVVDQVVVVYLASSPRYQRAYRLLSGEFSGDRYTGTACHLRGIPVRLGEATLAEARSPGEVNAVWETFYQLFDALKSQQQRIHLSLTGGRRIMALLACSVAMLHFDSADRAWHLHTPDEIVQRAYDGAMLHVPPASGLHLIEVPLTPWGTYFPGVRSLLGRSPQQVRGDRKGWLDENERARCRQVWKQLTPRQKDTLRALAETQTRKQAAEQLSISLATLDTHKTEIIQACRLVWETDTRFDVHFLRRKFAPFLAGLAPV